MNMLEHVKKVLSGDEGIKSCQTLFVADISVRHEPNKGTLRHHLIFVGFLLLLCATSAFIGVVPTHGFGHDAFFLLDNGWRTVNGQRPHLDYASGWGPLTFLVVGLGLELSNYTADGIGYGNAIFAFFIGLWSYLLSRGRLRPFLQITMSLCLVCLVVAPYPLGFSIFRSSHAMLYNRYGYALLGLILLEAFQPTKDKESRIGELSGGISSGAAMALALFLKVSYFIVALMLLFGASLLLWRWGRRRLFAVLFGFSLVTLAFLAYLNFDIHAILSDLQMTAKARSNSLFYGELLRKIKNNSVYYIAILLMSYACFIVARTDRSIRRLAQLSLWLGSLVFIADICLIFTNQQENELPLIAVFSLLQMEGVGLYFQKPMRPQTRSTIYLHFAVILLGCTVFLPRLTRDISAISYGAWQKAFPSNLNEVVRFSEPRLRPLLLYDGENEPKSNGSQYTSYINDGVALLRRVSVPHAAVLTMDMFNPFPYVMGWRPPIGGIAATAYNYTVSDSHRPSDDRYFGNADIIMFPKRPSGADPGDGFYKIYETGLHQRFYLAAESAWWYLYRRKK